MLGAIHTTAEDELICSLGQLCHVARNVERVRSVFVDVQHFSFSLKYKNRKNRLQKKERSALPSLKTYKPTMKVRFGRPYPIHPAEDSGLHPAM